MKEFDGSRLFISMDDGGETGFLRDFVANKPGTDKEFLVRYGAVLKSAVAKVGASCNTIHEKGRAANPRNREFKADFGDVRDDMLIEVAVFILSEQRKEVANWLKKHKISFRPYLFIISFRFARKIYDRDWKPKRIVPSKKWLPDVKTIALQVALDTLSPQLRLFYNLWKTEKWSDERLMRKFGYTPDQLKAAKKRVERAVREAYFDNEPLISDVFDENTAPHAADGADTSYTNIRENRKSILCALLSLKPKQQVFTRCCWFLNYNTEKLLEQFNFKTSNAVFIKKHRIAQTITKTAQRLANCPGHAISPMPLELLQEDEIDNVLTIRKIHNAWLELSDDEREFFRQFYTDSNFPETQDERLLSSRKEGVLRKLVELTRKTRG